MKTTTVKNNQPEVAPSKPFFNKSGKDTFFANGEVQKKDFYNSGSIQASLAVGEPDDPYEKEADKVSRQVVDGFDQVTSIQKKLSTFGLQPFTIQPFTIGNRISRKWQQTLSKTPVVVQKKCDQCEEEQKQAQPKSLGIQFAGDGAMVSPDIESRITSRRGGGSAMDEQTKSAMESSFGADFGGVKVHTDSHAVQMSQQLNAHAFTVGNDIFFNNGRYQPQTKEGAGLLAHELTHTVQQGASLQNKSINRQPFLNTLSNHASAHLSAINGSGLSALSRKEIAQLEKLPEEEMMKMQQLQMLQMKGVDKVQKKDSSLKLRRCPSTPPAATVTRPTQTVTMSGATCGSKYGAVGRYCYSGANNWWFKENVKGTKDVCQPGSIDQTGTPFQASGNCVSDAIFNFNGPPAKIAPCKDVTNQIVFTGPTKADVEMFQYKNQQIIEVTKNADGKSGKVITSSAGVATECNWP